jgi:hypothetical protein
MWQQSRLSRHLCLCLNQSIAGGCYWPFVVSECVCVCVCRHTTRRVVLAVSSPKRHQRHRQSPCPNSTRLFRALQSVLVARSLHHKMDSAGDHHHNAAWACPPETTPSLTAAAGHVHDDRCNKDKCKTLHCGRNPFTDPTLAAYPAASEALPNRQGLFAVRPCSTVALHAALTPGGKQCVPMQRGHQFGSQVPQRSCSN